MKCAICSTDNLSSALFCSGCGRQLSDPAVTKEKPHPNSDSGKPPDGSPRRPLRQTTKTSTPRSSQTHDQTTPVTQSTPEEPARDHAQPMIPLPPELRKQITPVVHKLQTPTPESSLSASLKKAVPVITLFALVAIVVLFLFWTRLESYWLDIPDSSVKSDYIVQSIQYPMISLPAGAFEMGSPSNEVGRGKEEVQHQVTLTRNFYLGATEVSQAQWQKIMRTNPSHFRGKNLPVDMVSWNDAVRFCNKLSEKEHLKPCYVISNTGVTWDASADGYRLPTEAEWEYACRSGTATPFNIGDQLTTDQANYDGRFPYGNNPKGEYRNITAPVESFIPSARGLYNMHGNVYEWCWDWHSKYDNSSAANKDPEGVKESSNPCRVIRGGSWGSNAESCRSASRAAYGDETRYDTIGFRIARFVSSGS